MTAEGKWMKFDKITLNGIIQTQRDKCLIFSLISGPSFNSSRGSKNATCSNYRIQKYQKGTLVMMRHRGAKAGGGVLGYGDLK